MKKYLLILSFFVFKASFSFAACMSGTYTIGGSSANFTTITSAVNSLIANGVCGPVVFKIANGAYNEQISIPAITGTSSVNTITFESAKNNIFSVDWEYASSSTAANNYVLQLNGANYIIFQNVSIKRTGSLTYCGVIDLVNSTSNITFTSDSIATQILYTASTTAPLVSSDSSNHSSLSFSNSTFVNGGYGIALAGASSASPSSNITLMGNNFISQTCNTVQLSFYTDVNISSNYINTGGSGSYYYTINMNYCNGANIIEKNVIVITSNSGGGISINNCNPSSATPGFIANNFISAYTSDAIIIGSSSYMDIYYNSVYFTYASGGTGFYLTGGSNIQFVDNCIYGGYIGMYIFTPAALVTCNYNNLMPISTSTTWLQTNSAKYGTLASWASATGFDKNSISVFPNYNSFTDLHIATNVDMFGKGTPIAGITTDIDGITRSSTNPNMGADEFADIPNNAAMKTIVEPTSPSCSGANPFIVKFRNMGSNNLTSVMLNWEVNNVVQPPYNWTGLMVPGDTSAPTTIGTYAFAGATYNTKIWVSNPNGAPATYHNNDTASLNGIITKMGGTYTIGGFNPDYLSFTAAIADLSKRSICSPVTFNVRSGTYHEQIVIPRIIGASAVNTITFQSEVRDSTMVVLYYDYLTSTTQYVLQLSGARYFTFSHMTLAANNTFYGYGYGIVLDLVGGASHITLEHDIVYDSSSYKNLLPNNNSLVYSDYSTSYTLNDSNTFNNNLFINGAMAINNPTDHNAVNVSHDWVVSHNIMKNQTEGFIQMGTSANPQITYNYCSTRRDTLQKGSIFVGISASASSQGAVITNNTVICDTGYGLWVSTNSSAAGKPILIANNMISMEHGTGLYSYNDSLALVYFNSVAILDKDSTSYAFNGSTANLLNNIFSNLGGGKVFNSPPTSLKSNYNDLFTTGNKFSNNYSTFAAWKAKGQDVNSDTVAPNFFSNTNLHIKSNSTLAGAAEKGTGITIDIDSLYRGSSPDIGAAQFPIAPLYDIGITSLVTPNSTNCHGSPNICISVKNFITQPADSIRTFNVYTQINGALINTLVWHGLLNAGDSIDTLSVAHYMFQYGKSYTIKIWTTYPNSSADVNTSNDTITVSNAYIAMGGTYTIGGYKPDFDSTLQAVQTILSMGVCDSVHFKYRPGQYHSIVIKSPIPGSSLLNTVTFGSEISDSLSVLLRDTIAFNSTTYDEAQALSLSHVSNVRVENMAFAFLKTGSNGATINDVYIDSSCSNITIAHNHIEYNVVMNGRNSLLYGNYFDQAEVRLIGNNTPGNIVARNILNSTSEDTAFYIYNQNNILFKGNEVVPIINQVQDLVSLYLYKCTSGEISCNKFFHLPVVEPFGGGVVILLWCHGTLANPVMVKNNYIVIGDNASSTGLSGIGAYSDTCVEYYHNSLVSDSASGYPYSNTLLTINGGLHNNVINNIMLSVLASYEYLTNVEGYTFYYSPKSVDTSDYNLFYSRLYATTDSTASKSISLEAWQAASGQDLHSQIGMPNFVHDTGIINYGYSPSDYMINPDLNWNGLNPFVSAKYLPGVSTDIYGRTRNTSTPMIGAYEYNNTAIINNASATSINQPTLNPCAGTDPINITIANFGTAPLTSVTVQWQMDGITQTPFSWTGSLASEDSTEVTIGTYNFAADSVQLKAWTILPNAKPDAYPRYDTVSMKIFTSYGGTYTVGGTSPDFATPQTALAALEKNGVCSPVILNIRDKEYRGALYITPIRGTSDINTVTFQSESHDSTRVVIIDNHNTTQPYTVTIAGAQHIRFRQMHITADNPPNQISGIFKIFGGTKDIILANNIIEVNNGDSANGWYYTFDHNSPVFIGTETQYENPVADSIKILNNYIKRGEDGVYYKDVWSFLQYGTGLVISGNTFWATETPININFANSPVVTYNNITADSTDGYYIDAINMSSCIDSTNVSYNTVYANAGVGVNMGGCTGTPSAHCKVYNNSISILEGSSSTGGIAGYVDTLCDYYYNSIYIGKPSNYYSSWGMSFSKCTEQTVKNNIIMNTAGGWALYDSLSTNSIFNHNDYYITVGSLFRSNSVNYTTLSAWQAATHSDSNSFAVNPSYESISNLHFTFRGISRKGVPISGITNDITGKTRSLTEPDMGCYEENLSPLIRIDAGIDSIIAMNKICVNTNTAIKVRVKDFGPVKDTLQYVSINWTINNVTQPTYTWTGMLPADSISSYITIGNYDFKNVGATQLKIWTSLPNLLADTNNVNDTLSSSVFINQLPKPKLGNDTTICNNDSLVLNPGTFSSYVWSPANTGPTYTVKAGGIFYVTVTDANGCKNSDTIDVNTKAIPQPTLLTNVTFCQGLTDTLKPGSFTTYIWSTGSTTSNIAVTKSGTYKVTVTNNGGCSAIDSTVVTVNPIPPVPTISANGNSFTSSSTMGNQWYINTVATTGATGQVYNATGPGTVYVIVTNSFGCSSQSTSVISSVGIGNITSSNGELNIYPNPSTGVFNIDSTFTNETLEISVYNLLGEIIYQAKLNSANKVIDLDNEPVGIYFYRAITEKSNKVSIGKLIIQK